MRELSSNQIDATLETAEYGFLGLAREDMPYVVPMSFGYDGEDLYFQMNSQGRKFDFMADETPACFTTVRFAGQDEPPKSIMVEGVLSEMTEEASIEGYEALADNANFGTDLTLWGPPIEETDPTLFVLRPAEIAGRAFGA